VWNRTAKFHSRRLWYRHNQSCHWAFHHWGRTSRASHIISPGHVLQSFRFSETQQQLTWVLSSRLEEQSRISCHLEISTAVKNLSSSVHTLHRRTEPWKHQKDRWTGVRGQNNHCRENDNLRRYPVRRVLMSILPCVCEYSHWWAIWISYSSNLIIWTLPFVFHSFQAVWNCGLYSE